MMRIYLIGDLCDFWRSKVPDREQTLKYVPPLNRFQSAKKLIYSYLFEGADGFLFESSGLESIKGLLLVFKLEVGKDRKDEMGDFGFDVYFWGLPPPNRTGCPNVGVAIH